MTSKLKVLKYLKAISVAHPLKIFTFNPFEWDQTNSCSWNAIEENST
jgi:hypothetical protein